MEYKIGEIVFTDWQITKEIGEGSCGKVYEIQKTNYGITSRSALKVIRIPHSVSDIKTALGEGLDEHSVTTYFQGFVDEIVQEISVMSSLKSHSNIVGYEDHCVLNHPGEIGWDILIRMELLTPLSDYFLTHPLDETEVVQLAKDVCSALSFCQKKGMIHRDIKPENIFVNEIGQFKLGDFGVARTVEKTTGGLSKKGTESYMAPEVYLGKPYGSSVDIYSLGLMLYKFTNSNRLPLFPPAPQPITFADRENALLRRMKGETLPPPVNAQLAFADIILKACAYDPEDRYRTAADMLDDLEHLKIRPRTPMNMKIAEIKKMTKTTADTDNSVFTASDSNTTSGHPACEKNGAVENPTIGMWMKPPISPKPASPADANTSVTMPVITATGPKGEQDTHSTQDVRNTKDTQSTKEKAKTPKTWKTRKAQKARNKKIKATVIQKVKHTYEIVSKFCETIRDKRGQKKRPNITRFAYTILVFVAPICILLSVLGISTLSSQNMQYEVELEKAETALDSQAYIPAATYFKKAKDIAPWKAEPYIKLTEIYITQERPIQAEKTLAAAQEQSEHLWGGIFLRDKTVQETLKELQTQLETLNLELEELQEYHDVLSDANKCYENGDSVSAIEKCQQALAMKPEQENAYTTLLQIQKECAMFEEAEQTIELGKQNGVDLANEEQVYYTYKKNYGFMTDLPNHLTDDYDATLEWIKNQYSSFPSKLYFQNNKITPSLENAYAIIYEPNVGVYCGDIKNGKRQGNGKQHLACSDSYDCCVIDGIWETNEVMGYAEVYFPHRSDNCRVWYSGNFMQDYYSGDITIKWQYFDTGLSYTATGHAEMGFWHIIRETDGKKIYAESPEGSYWYFSEEQTSGHRLPCYFYFNKYSKWLKDDA